MRSASEPSRDRSLFLIMETHASTFIATSTFGSLISHILHHIYINQNNVLYLCILRLGWGNLYSPLPAPHSHRHYLMAVDLCMFSFGSSHLEGSRLAQSMHPRRTRDYILRQQHLLKRITLFTWPV